MSPKAIDALRWIALTPKGREFHNSAGTILPFEEDLLEGIFQLELMDLVRRELISNPNQISNWETARLVRCGCISKMPMGPEPIGTIVVSCGGGVIMKLTLTEAGRREARQSS